MKKAETKFRQKADKDLETIPFSWWETIQQRTIVGSPDKIGCVRGHFVAIEFKKDDKCKLGKMQEYKRLCIVNTAEGIHVTACPENWPEIMTFLLDLAEGDHL